MTETVSEFKQRVAELRTKRPELSAGEATYVAMVVARARHRPLVGLPHELRTAIAADSIESDADPRRSDTEIPRFIADNVRAGVLREDGP